jgi:hypothetical protein
MIAIFLDDTTEDQVRHGFLDRKPKSCEDSGAPMPFLVIQHRNRVAVASMSEILCTQNF